MKVLHSYLTFAKRAFKKKSAFYLNFEKIARFEPKIAIFAKLRWNSNFFLNVRFFKSRIGM